MRRWIAAAVPALGLVAERPALWVVGGLAWASTAGPIALLAAVVPIPTASDLTYLGARAFVSGAWPWNAITLGALAVAAVLVALLFVALADVTIARAGPAGWRAVAAAFAATVIGALAAVLPAIAATIAVATAARVEFTAPDSGEAGPLLRTLAAVAPLLLLCALAAVAGATWAVAARVLLAVGGTSLGRAVAGAFPALVGGGAASALHALVASLAWAGYLALSVVLLAVLWAPIGGQVASGAGFGAAEAALLVGFVAIWLCLVLGGGALHAWGVVSWTRILAMPRRRSIGVGPMSEETPPTP